MAADLKGRFVRSVIVLVAAFLAASPVVFATGVCDLNPLYCYEAENATTRVGLTTVNTTTEGNSGTGYLTGFDNTGDYFEMTVNAPTGLYELWVGYRVPTGFGDKGY